jgi:hypothetical protein
MSKSRFMYVSARKTLEIALFLRKLLKLLLHCRTNTDGHVSIYVVHDWLSDFAKRHMCVISCMCDESTFTINKVALQ